MDLVGALRRRFEQCVQPALLRSELSNRRRQPGELLRVLVNDIESLSQRAYAHMPPSVQSELARDQFIQVLSPTQLAHPESFQPWRWLWRGSSCGLGLRWGCMETPTVRAVVQSSPGPEKPAWVAEMTELIRAVSLEVAQNTRPGPMV